MAVELLGIITADSTISGGLSGTFNLAGTIANSTTVSGVMRYVAVNVREQHVYRRLVAVGNDILYYEDI